MWFPVSCLLRYSSSHGVCSKSRRGETSSLEHFSENLKKGDVAVNVASSKKKIYVLCRHHHFYSSQPSRDSSQPIRATRYYFRTTESIVAQIHNGSKNEQSMYHRHLIPYFFRSKQTSNDILWVNE